jgi:hypothetical protein
MSFGGVVMILVGFCILAAYGYYGYHILSFPTEVEDYWADAYKAEKIESSEILSPDPLPRMLFMASGSTARRVQPEDVQTVLGDRQINGLIRKYLKRQAQGKLQLLDLERVETVVRFQADHIEFIDKAACLGRKILIRYHMFYKLDGDTFTFDEQHVYLGNARLPAFAASYLFRQFYGDLQQYLSETNLARIYAVQKIEPGVLTLACRLALSSPIQDAKKMPASARSEEVSQSVTATPPSVQTPSEPAETP